MPIAGGAVERLTTDPAAEFAPDLSPDGREVAFHSFRSGSRDIFVKPIDGGASQQVTTSAGQESYPRWSPDGRAIVYFDQAVDAGVFRGLFLLRRDETGGRRSAPVELRRGVGAGFAWIRDGRAIAYPRGGSIELVDLESRTVRVVYAPSGPDDPAAGSVETSEDGRTLYFKSHDAQQRASLWAVPLAGGRPTLLVRFSDPLRESIRRDFAVGAGRFFFTLEDRQADIWLAETIPAARSGR
jgi:TolB protein